MTRIVRREFELLAPLRALVTPRRLSAALVVTALVSRATPASASREYPEAVRSALDLPCPPPCMLCHVTPTGGLGTANQPFSVNLVAVLNRHSVGLMKQLLTALETLPCKRTEDPSCAANPMMCGACDADGDGVTDVKELRAGTNPNPGGADFKCPEYGCGAHIAPVRASRRIDGKAALAALGTLVVLAGLGRRAAKRRRV